MYDVDGVRPSPFARGKEDVRLHSRRRMLRLYIGSNTRGYVGQLSMEVTLTPCVRRTSSISPSWDVS